MSTFKTTRIFSAPAEAVFSAFETPNRLAKWWGPNGFRNTFETFEFKPDGLWRFTMHGPDGSNYPNESIFVSIEQAREISLKHLSQPHFQLTITFASTGSGTLVTWEQVFEDAAIAANIRHIVEPANEQNLDRWEAEVRAGESGGISCLCT
jgi:uncharacterized protein YndB with AHSA1/START domain